MIDKYLFSACLLAKDEFNNRYVNKTKNELIEIAKDFSELDLVYRIGSPFRHMAIYNSNSAGDIIIPDKEYQIEIKYLKCHLDTNGNNCNKTPWVQVDKDFNWIIEEVQFNKGKRAFIIGWFNVVDSFYKLTHLGTARGKNKEINLKRLKLFPFTYCQTEDKTEIKYDYSKTYDILLLEEQNNLNCIFFGEEQDKFHCALYW